MSSGAVSKCLCDAVAQAFHIYLKFEAYPDALMVALRAGERELQERAFGSCSDFLLKQQLCHILARQVRSQLETAPEVLPCCRASRPSRSLKLLLR